MQRAGRLDRAGTPIRARGTGARCDNRLELRRSCVVKRGTFIVSMSYGRGRTRLAEKSDETLTETAKKKPEARLPPAIYTHTK